MKYLLFGGEQYYPAGGWKDFLRAFDTEEAAKEFKHGQDWAQIVRYGRTGTGVVLFVWGPRGVGDGQERAEWRAPDPELDLGH